MSKYTITVNKNIFEVTNEHLKHTFFVEYDPKESSQEFLKRVWNTYPKRVFYLVKERFNRMN